MPNAVRVGVVALPVPVDLGSTNDTVQHDIPKLIVPYSSVSSGKPITAYVQITDATGTTAASRVGETAIAMVKASVLPADLSLIPIRDGIFDWDKDASGNILLTQTRGGDIDIEITLTGVSAV